MTPASAQPSPSLGALFLRFLRFGVLAFGGPFAQIDMIRRECVEEEHWISPEEFRRALAVYQALPGPEAHEMCVYLGMRARGRLGGFLAGLGFMLPGVALVLTLSSVYFAGDGWSTAVRSAFAGMQAAALALIARATIRLGRDSLRGPGHLAIAAIALGASTIGTPGTAVLLGSGLLGMRWPTVPPSGAPTSSSKSVRLRNWLFPAAGVGVFLLAWWLAETSLATSSSASPATLSRPDLPDLGLLGLKAGLLTFGGAYTALPLLRETAVVSSGWMTDSQFLDGLAGVSVLPTPLITVATFVAYAGSSLAAALGVTMLVFAPSFLMTILGHAPLESLIQSKRLRPFLEGVAAGVIGLITVTLIQLTRGFTANVPFMALASGSLIALLLLRSRYAPMFVTLIAAAIGLLAF